MVWSTFNPLHGHWNKTTGERNGVSMLKGRINKRAGRRKGGIERDRGDRKRKVGKKKETMG